MAKITRWHEDILKILEELGLKEQHVRSKRHIVVTGVLNGRPFSWTTSATPSDRHVCKRQIADLKRELRKCGVEEPPKFAMRFLTLVPVPEDIWETVWATEATLNREENTEQSR